MSDKPSVLLVDDNHWFAEALIARLSQYFSVRWAEDAQTAIELVDEAPPAVIVLDMLMPGANGSVFLQELHSYGDTANTPVIICSSVALTHYADALKAYGVQVIIDKNKLELDELEAAITHLTQKVTYAQ